MLIHTQAPKNLEMVKLEFSYMKSLGINFFNFCTSMKRKLLQKVCLIIIERETNVSAYIIFGTEVKLLSRVKHRNLVGLVGYCEEDGTYQQLTQISD